MQPIDMIRTMLQANEFDMRLFEDMRDAPLTQPTERGGNHPLWVLGHLASSEGAFHEMITGEPNPLAHWRPLFDQGTEPKAEVNGYPTFDEVLSAYREQRGRSMALLEEIGEAGLDQPPRMSLEGIPAEAQAFFATVGQVFLTMASHHAFHSGQVADARRAAGREPLMA